MRGGYLRCDPRPAILPRVNTPLQEDTVPRDPVWRQARRYKVPRAEMVRMGGLEAAVGSAPQNPHARMSRTAAVALLGELEVDRRWPAWGEHRAALAYVPCARLQADFHRVISAPQAERIHRQTVTALGTRALDAILGA